jgi:cysteine synthase B
MMERGEALELVRANIPNANLVNHSVAVEVIMEALARHFGLAESDIQRWALAGLLHDLDYATTAEEIIRDTVGRITHFVSALGTSGTLMGTAKRLNELNPNIKIVEAQPVRGHYIQGLKNMSEAIVPEIYDPTKIDISIMIDSEEAFEMARRIVKEEGIFCGMSSGAAMLASLKVAERIDKGVIVCIFPDRGEKYLSTALFK